MYLEYLLFLWLVLWLLMWSRKPGGKLIRGSHSNQEAVDLFNIYCC